MMLQMILTIRKIATFNEWILSMLRQVRWPLSNCHLRDLWQFRNSLLCRVQHLLRKAWRLIGMKAHWADSMRIVLTLKPIETSENILGVPWDVHNSTFDHSYFLCQLLISQGCIFGNLNVFRPFLFDKLFESMLLKLSFFLSLYLLNFALLLLFRRFNSLIPLEIEWTSMDRSLTRMIT